MSNLPSPINNFFYYSFASSKFFFSPLDLNYCCAECLPIVYLFFYFFYGECCLMDWWISNLRFMRCAIYRLHLLIDLVVWVLFWWLYSHWMRLISDWTCPIDVSLIWNGILGILDGWHSLHCLVTWFNGSAALPPALGSPEAEFYMWWMIGFLECFFSFSF